jgi:hypothetical protein
MHRSCKSYNGSEREHLFLTSTHEPVGLPMRPLALGPAVVRALTRAATHFGRQRNRAAGANPPGAYEMRRNAERVVRLGLHFLQIARVHVLQHRVRIHTHDAPGPIGSEAHLQQRVGQRMLKTPNSHTPGNATAGRCTLSHSASPWCKAPPEHTGTPSADG